MKPPEALNTKAWVNFLGWLCVVFAPHWFWESAGFLRTMQVCVRTPQALLCACLPLAGSDLYVFLLINITMSRIHFSELCEFFSWTFKCESGLGKSPWTCSQCHKWKWSRVDSSVELWRWILPPYSTRQKPWAELAVSRKCAPSLIVWLLLCTTHLIFGGNESWHDHNYSLRNCDSVACQVNDGVWATGVKGNE